MYEHRSVHSISVYLLRFDSRFVWRYFRTKWKLIICRNDRFVCQVTSRIGFIRYSFERFCSLSHLEQQIVYEIETKHSLYPSVHLETLFQFVFQLPFIKSNFLSGREKETFHSPRDLLDNLKRIRKGGRRRVVITALNLMWNGF